MTARTAIPKLLGLDRRELLAGLGASALISACSTTPIMKTDKAMTQMPDKAPLIIEVSINGMTPKAVNPNVPRTPDEVTTDALACIAAGATIIHSHTDDPVVGGGTGRHDPEPLVEAWAPVLEKHPEVLFYPTMQGGGGETTIEERAFHMQALIDANVLRMAMIDLGTINISIIGEDNLPLRTDAVFINTTADAHYMFEFCELNKVGASVGCIEPGAARTAMAFADQGRLPKGSMFRLMFGGPGVFVGLPPKPAALDVMLDIISPANRPWSVGVSGGDVFAEGFAEYILRKGGNIRLGLEDYRADDTPTNAELVGRLVELAEQVGRPIATVAQTNKMLGLTV